MFELAVKLQRRNRCTGAVYQPVRWYWHPLPSGSGPQTTSWLIGEGVRKVYEEVLVPAGMG